MTADAVAAPLICSTCVTTCAHAAVTQTSKTYCLNHNVQLQAIAIKEMNALDILKLQSNRTATQYAMQCVQYKHAYSTNNDSAEANTRNLQYDKETQL
jgi:hypothetical protein